MGQQWGRVGIVKEMQERQRGLVREWVLRSIEVLCNNGKTFHTKPERPARGTPQLLDSERRVCQKPLEGKMGYGGGKQHGFFATLSFLFHIFLEVHHSDFFSACIMSEYVMVSCSGCGEQAGRKIGGAESRGMISVLA